MIHPEDLERIRKMAPEERVGLGLELADLGWEFLLDFPAEERQRRMDLVKRRPWNPPPGPMEE